MGHEQLDPLPASNITLEETGESPFLLPCRKMIYPNPFVPIYILNFHSVLWQEVSHLTPLVCEDFPVIISDVSAGNPAVHSAELPSLRPLAVGLTSNCGREIGCDMPPWEGCCVPWSRGAGWLISSWSTGTGTLCLWGVDGKIGIF